MGQKRKFEVLFPCVKPQENSLNFTFKPHGELPSRTWLRLKYSAFAKPSIHEFLLYAALPYIYIYIIYYETVFIHRRKKVSAMKSASNRSDEIKSIDQVRFVCLAFLSKRKKGKLYFKIWWNRFLQRWEKYFLIALNERWSKRFKRLREKGNGF